MAGGDSGTVKNTSLQTAAVSLDFRKFYRAEVNAGANLEFFFSTREKFWRRQRYRRR